MATRLALAVTALLALAAAPSAGQNTYEDPEKRFTVTLPAGFEMQSEQLGKIYSFKRPGCQLAIIVESSSGGRDAAWATAVGYFANGKSIAPPAPDAVFDMDVNGNPARWAAYPTEADAGGKKIKVMAYLGAVVLEGTPNSVIFFTMLAEKAVKASGQGIVDGFNSIRVPGVPLIGATGRAPAVVKPPVVRTAEATDRLSGEPVPYLDPESRFTFDLPGGFAFESEKLGGRFYTFALGSRKLVVLVGEGVADRDEAWSFALSGTTGKSLSAPPAEAVFDLTVNGRPARWATWVVENDAGQGRKVKLTACIGVVLIESPKNSVSFFTVMNDAQAKSDSAAIERSFASIRPVGAQHTGPAGREAARVKPVVAAATAAAAPPPPVESTGTPFQHPLVSLQLPPGWKAEPLKSPLIASLSSSKYSGLVITGLEKNKLGKSREDILKTAVKAMRDQFPSYRQSREPYELPTSAEGPVLLTEFTAEIVAQGKTLSMWGLVGAYKDAKRGLMFAWAEPGGTPDSVADFLKSLMGSLR